jgi:hypothetical protein
VDSRPPWSRRRRRTLIGLALGIVACGLAAIGLPGEYGAKAAVLAALSAFLLAAATVVFLVVPGPDTLGTLLRSVPLAGACLVVAVLLLLSTDDELRRLWWLAVVVTGGWTAAAVWQTRRSGV